MKKPSIKAREENTTYMTDTETEDITASLISDRHSLLNLNKHLRVLLRKV